MKIAILNNYYYPNEIGGAERSVRVLAESLIERGHDVLVISTGAKTDTSSISKVQLQQIKLSNIYFPLSSGARSPIRKLVWHVLDVFNIAMAVKCWRVLASFKPDILHTNNVAGASVAVWAVAHKLNIPIVHTLRDYYLLCPRTSMFRGDAPCTGKCTSCLALSVPKRLASQKISAVVGNSKFILDKHITRGYFKGVPNAVIYNAYHPQDAEADLRMSGKCTFGYIGRLSPTKGVHELIRAFGEIANRNNQCRLLIAGSGTPEYRAELQKLAAGLPIEFLGTITPQEFYPRLDWCVVPSLWDEPLARVIFEAFSHAVPVIATTTGGSPELVSNGENGFTYTAGNLNMLTVTLQIASEIEDNEWSIFSARAKSDGARFRPGNVVSEYAKLYSDIFFRQNLSRLT